jgi:hypothetical protein
VAGTGVGEGAAVGVGVAAGAQAASTNATIHSGRKPFIAHLLS